MKRLWIAFIVLATLGSIYPFNFQSVSLDAAFVAAFLQSCCESQGRGDVLGNVLLFLPIGFLGMFALRPEASARRRFALLTLMALGLGAALQLAQIFLPTRDANLQDVLWNMVGTIAGAWLAVLADRHRSKTDDASFAAEVVPFALICTWLVYRLMPFVPSIDLQLVKDSIKPLLSPNLSFANVAPDFAAWLVIGYLLQAMRPGARLQRMLPLLVFAVFILEIFIVENALYMSDVVAAVIAVATLPFLLRASVRPEVVLVALLFTGFLFGGLSPFSLSHTSSEFSWLPFHGFLDGSMYVNALSAARKVFLFGSLVFLLRQLSVGYVASVGFLFVTVFAVELLQTRLVGHTPEITDPILVLLAALALYSLSQQSLRIRPAGLAPARPHLRDNRQRELRNKHWITQTIDLHEDQYRFLGSLAEEMKISRSRVVRHIVRNFLKELDAAPGTDRYNGNGIQEIADETIRRRRLTGRESSQWVVLTVNLRGSHYKRLTSVAESQGISVSRAIRRIVARFIENLDDDPPAARDRV